MVFDKLKRTMVGGQFFIASGVYHEAGDGNYQSSRNIHPKRSYQGTG